MYADRHLFTVKLLEVNELILLAANHIQGKPDDKFRDGVLFLWAIIHRTTAQTNATISANLDQLGSMTTIMEEAKNEIKVYNTNIYSLLNEYTANQQEEYNDTILINALFKA
jgi:hypothetical protein